MRKINATPSDVERFFRHVDKLPNGCWFWTGARSRGSGNKKWYGSFRVRVEVDGVEKSTAVRAHAFSCDVLGGKVCPPGHHRDHSCVFSLCVNYDHIDIVTKASNQDRKMQRRGGAAAPTTVEEDHW